MANSLSTTLLTALAISGSLFGAEVKKAGAESPANYNIPLWEESKVPLSKGNGPTDRPFLTVFLPPEGKGNGGSVVVAPGGGDIMLMYGGEGMDIAERYNDWGVAAFVLTYRMSPRYGADARILDGNRAVQLVRSRASQFKLDPTKVGFIGFSAGSSLGRSVVAAAKPGDANSADPVERFSSRPDYLGLVYSAGRATPGESLKSFPPTFLVSAAADGPAIPNAQLFSELTRAGAVAEIHVYQKGRHGFGSGYGSPEFGEWMSALKHFLVMGGFIPGAK